MAAGDYLIFFGMNPIGREQHEECIRRNGLGNTHDSI